MAVLLNTSLGDIVIDLYTDQCPLTTKNFLKLCKIKYYNNCLFHTVQKDFLVQTGDPTGAGSGGDSIYKFLYGDQARFFNDEIHQNLKHDKIGVVAMASAGENLNASQFYITTRADLDYLDGKHTVFGVVAEGEEVLMKINEVFVDERNRPYKNIRIKHTCLLDDPFEDPVQLAELIPENSPALRPPAEGEEVRLEDDWVPMDEQLEPEELDKSLRRKEAHSRAVVLEMIGDIPDAEIKPPENVLFVCKLNPVTQDEDLEIIFSRFGKIISADIIRDYKTGDSLCYAFIEFDTQEACEAAYFKMDNVLIDDRRIHVDFSQSVSRLWTRYRRFGKKDMDDGKGSNFAPNSKGTGCFKCGAAGHFAKDCPEEKEKETPQERPKYKLKSAEGQRGGAATSYDMVFEDTSDLENERDDPTSSEDRMHRSKPLPTHVSHRNRDHHAAYHENRDSKKYHESDEKHHRKQRHIPGGNHESRDRVGDKRSERNTSPHDRDGRYGGSDRHKSRRDGSPEDGYFSRHHVSSSTQKRHRDSSQEDHYAHRHHDRHGKNDSSGSRSRQKEGSPNDEHPRIHRDRDGRHDLSGTKSRRTQESPERHHSGKRMEDKYAKDGKHDLSGTRSRQTQESPERYHSGKRKEDKYAARSHRSENHRHNKDRLKGEREMRDE